MFGKETPSSVLYQDLKTFGGISNKEAARIMLSGRIQTGGMSPRDHADNRTYLSRYIVHVEPQDVNPHMFTDLSQASQTLMRRILDNEGTGGRPGVLSHYLGPGIHAMQAVYAEYGLDSLMLGNEAQRLSRVQLRNESDRALLVLMLFVAAGCLANADAAVATVEGFAQRTLALCIATIESTAGPSPLPPQLGPAALYLARLVDGNVRKPYYPLNPKGTIIGSLAKEPGSIKNVDVDVSRQHLRIWLDGARWLCQGLDSTNGTVLISAADKSAQTVEPPRSARHGAIYPPVPIESGDILCLGRTTRFYVMSLGSLQ